MKAIPARGIQGGIEVRTTIMLGSNQYCHDKTYQGRCDREGLLILMIERKIKGGQEGKGEKEWSVRGRERNHQKQYYKVYL